MLLNRRILLVAVCLVAGCLATRIRPGTPERPSAQGEIVLAKGGQ